MVMSVKCCLLKKLDCDIPTSYNLQGWDSKLRNRCIEIKLNRRLKPIAWHWVSKWNCVLAKWAFSGKVQRIKKWVTKINALFKIFNAQWLECNVLFFYSDILIFF
jgi:hypothetical protein